MEEERERTENNDLNEENVLISTLRSYTVHHYIYTSLQNILGLEPSKRFSNN